MGLSNPPEILYKYSSFDGAEAIIESGKIKITPPTEFNDPFEFLPGGYKDISKDAFIREFSSSCPRSTEIQRLINTREARNVQEAEDVYNRKIDDAWTEYVNTLQNRNFKSLKEGTCKLIAVLSLSEDYKSILMWSHYGEKHQGVVIGFDPEKLSINQRQCYHIQYSNTRGRLAVDSSARSKNLETLISTKAKQWVYEKEWRAIYKLDSLEKEGERYLFKFPADAVREVIIGAETPDDKRKEIALLVKKNYPEAKIKQAELSQDMFALEIN